MGPEPNIKAVVPLEGIAENVPKHERAS